MLQHKEDLYKLAGFLQAGHMYHVTKCKEILEKTNGAQPKDDDAEAFVIHVLAMCMETEKIKILLPVLEEMKWDKFGEMKHYYENANNLLSVFKSMAAAQGKIWPNLNNIAKDANA